MKIVRYQDSKQDIEENNHFPELSKLTFHQREMNHLTHKKWNDVLLFSYLNANVTLSIRTKVDILIGTGIFNSKIRKE